MADDTDKSDFTDDEGKSVNDNFFGGKPKHHKGMTLNAFLLADILHWIYLIHSYNYQSD